MFNSGPFSVAYDRGGDVLYMTLRRAVAARALQDANGIVWRYAEDETLIGITILDFMERWGDRLQILADRLSLTAPVSFSQIQEAIESAARIAA